MEKKKELEKKIRYQVECEKRAHLLVQQLLDNPITEEFLLQSGQLIKPEHYEDITEERAISMLCGYPVCSNTLKSMPKQQYHISTRTNKVYDIKQRKNFCSNECYNASKFFLSQLSSSPLWMRKDENSLKLSLLPREDARGKCGEEVMLVSKEMQKEIQVLEKPNNKEQRKLTEKESPEPDQLDMDKLTITDQRETLLIDTHNVGNTSEGIDSDTDESSINRDKILKSDQKDSAKCESSLQNSSGDDAQAKMVKLMSLLDRRKHLLGKMAQVENLSKTEKNNVSEKTKADKSAEEEVKHSERSSDTVDVNINVSKEHKVKVEVIKSVDEDVLKDISTEQRKLSNNTNMTQESKSNPPEKVTLQESKAHHQVKVAPQAARQVSVMRCICSAVKQWVTPETRSFLRFDKTDSDTQQTERLTFTSEMEEGYRNLCRRLDAGDTELDLSDGEREESDLVPYGQRPLPDYERLRKDTEEFSDKIQNFLGGKEQKTGIKENVSAKEKPVYLPSVDRHDQMLIRQKIVMERLHKVMPDFLPPLKLSIQDVFSPLKQLVATFSLSSKNILFKPAEWTLIGLLLLKMLACKELGVACAFMNPTAVQYFTILLQGVGDSLENVDSYVTEILND